MGCKEVGIVEAVGIIVEVGMPIASGDCPLLTMYSYIFIVVDMLLTMVYSCRV